MARNYGKIFVKIAVFDTNNHPTPILKEWGFGFLDLGHEVDFYPTEHHTILACMNKLYDLIVYVGSIQLHEFELVKQQNSNVKIVCATDQMQPHFYQLKGIVEFFITTQHECPSLVNEFKQIGFDLKHVPLAGNNHLFYPEQMIKQYDVCFIGTLGHGYRGEDKYLYPVLDNPNYNCYLAGMQYKHYNTPFLPYDQANAIRNSSKININFHVAYQHRGLGNPIDRVDLNQSVYNIALAGGFQICDHALASELFDGNIILGNEDNWNDLIAYYINNDDARNKLAKQSYEIAITKHTWKARMCEFLNILEKHNHASIHN